MELDNFFGKMIALIIAEVIGALFFLFLLVMVIELNKATGITIFTPELIVFFWTIYGFGTPIALFTPIIELVQNGFRH